MASRGDSFLQNCSVGDSIDFSIISLGDEIVWIKESDFPVGVFPQSIDFDSEGEPDREVTVTFRSPIDFESVERNVILPEGVQAEFVSRMISGITNSVTLRFSAEVNNSLNTLNQQIQIRLTNSNMALNISVRRIGNRELNSFRVSGSTTTSRLGGDVFFYVRGSNPSGQFGGAPYTLTETQQGANDDTAGFSFTPTTGTADFVPGTAFALLNASSVVATNNSLTITVAGNQRALTNYTNFLSAFNFDTSGITASNRTLTFTERRFLGVSGDNFLLQANTTISATADYATITITSTGSFVDATFSGSQLLLGSNGTVHTGTWTENLETRQRDVRLTATNDAVPSNTVTQVFSQGADTAVDISFTTSDTSPIAGDTSVVLTASILTGDAPYDYRIFTGDTTDTLNSTTAFTSTANRIFTSDASTSATQTVTRTAIDGANTYTVYARETNTPSEVASRVLTFYGSPAHAIAVPNLTEDIVPWYATTARLTFRIISLNGQTVSATVAGTDTNSSAAVTHVSGDQYRLDVTWTSGNLSTTSSRNAIVTVSYLGVNCLGSLIVSQNRLDSTVTRLMTTDAAGDTSSRDWNDLTSRQVGVSISRFPGIGSSYTFTRNGASTQTQAIFIVASSSGTGNNRTLVINKSPVFSDAQLTNLGITTGSTIVIRGSGGQYSNALVGAITSTTINLTGVDESIVLAATSTRISYFSYGFQSETITLNPVAVTGVQVMSGDTTLASPINLTHSGATTSPITSAAGYKATIAAPAVNASTTVASQFGYTVSYLGVTIPVAPSTGRTTQNVFGFSLQARPYVTQRLLNAAGIAIDTNTTFDTILSEVAGAEAQVWVLHDINQDFLSITDGGIADDDFLDLTSANVESSNDGITLPTGFSSTVVADNGDNISTSLYARRTRIDLDSANANSTTSTESDQICINFTNS